MSANSTQTEKSWKRYFGLFLLSLIVLPLSLASPIQANGPFTRLPDLNNPLGGLAPFVGMNPNTSATFSDIDADGDFDLFLGLGGLGTLYYENVGHGQTAVFRPRLDDANPLQGVQGFKIALVDIDDDNDLDAFIGQENGGEIRYYENIGSPTNPNFVQRTGTADPLNNLDFAGSTIYPAFVDIDADGDWDLFVGSGYIGGMIQYFENTGSAIIPTFVERTGSANPLSNVTQWRTPTFVDLDQDGDMDAFAGSPTTYYRNIGDAQNPIFSQQSGANDPFSGFAEPPQTISFVDLNFDGDFDAFDHTLSYYENIGSPQSPTFTQITDLQSPLRGILHSVPALVDIDADGDLDVFVGAGRKQPNFGADHEMDGKIIYYENSGSALELRLAGGNPFNGVDVGDYSSPAFVDIDGDGDFDAFIGEWAGNVNYFENTGNAQNPVFVAQTGSTNPLAGVQVGYRSAPTFVDIDGDGDFDAFIGSQFESGTADDVSYFENIGTAQNPAFVERLGLDNPFFALLPYEYDTQPRFLDIDEDGDFDAFIGVREGIVYYFENTGSPQIPFLVPRGSAAPLNAEVAGNAAPTFGDFDGDGDVDAFIGSQIGTVDYYRNEAIPSPTTVSAPISVASGGTLNSGNGLTLTFPPGAVPTNVIVTYQELPQPTFALSGGYQAVRSFTLEARDGNNQLITTFDEPYTLTIDYSDTELAARSLVEAELNLHYWNGFMWMPMLPCPNCNLNTNLNRLTIVADHFTEFALMSRSRQVFLPIISK